MGSNPASATCRQVQSPEAAGREASAPLEMLSDVILSPLILETSSSGVSDLGADGGMGFALAQTPYLGREFDRGCP